MTKEDAINIFNEQFCGLELYCELHKDGLCITEDCEIWWALKALEQYKGGNMSDYIDRQAAELAFIEKGQASKRYKVGDFWELNGAEIREALDTVPSADVQPVRHEHWGSKNECSGCGCQPWYERDIRFLHYCPNCGARMDGEYEAN